MPGMIDLRRLSDGFGMKFPTECLGQDGDAVLLPKATTRHFHRNRQLLRPCDTIRALRRVNEELQVLSGPDATGEQ